MARVFASNNLPTSSIKRVGSETTISKIMDKYQISPRFIGKPLGNIENTDLPGPSFRLLTPEY